MLQYLRYIFYVIYVYNYYSSINIHVIAPPKVHIFMSWKRYMINGISIIFPMFIIYSSSAPNYLIKIPDSKARNFQIYQASHVQSKTQKIKTTQCQDDNIINLKLSLPGKFQMHGL